MTDTNPWKKPAPQAPVDLSKLDSINIPGEPLKPNTKIDKTIYDMPFSARISQETHDKIKHIKDNSNPDIKRSLGVILEQAVDLYIQEKGIKL